MFELALKSRIPLITTRTDDLASVKRVVDFYLKTEEAKAEVVSSPEDAGDEFCWHIWFFESEENTDWVEVYEQCKKAESCLVIVNNESPVPMAFDSGELSTPMELISMMAKKFLHKSPPASILNSLTGLTLKNVFEILSMCQTKFGSITQANIISIRNQLFGNMYKGLKPVPVDLPFYVPNLAIKQWLQKESKFFFNAPDKRLRAKGLLLEGDPGTGKTLAAKYIARYLKIPIYRLDLGAAMEKYVGASESNLETALDRIDKEEPCVLLVDEVEKMLSSEDDSGVVERMYAKVLWWLQEHESRVLTIMTTNNKEKLKPELYREGRVDKVVEMLGLKHQYALKFGYNVYKSFKGNMSEAKFKKELDKYLEQNNLVKDRISHATITFAVYDIIKSQIK